MFSPNLVFNYFCLITLVLVFTLGVVVKSDNETFCSKQSSLIPFGGFCNQSSQCITDYCNASCVCPVNTYYNNCTASCVLNCNVTTPNPSGQFASPNYPKENAIYNSCWWTLSGNSNIYYVVSISEVYNDNYFACPYDYLRIYDDWPQMNTPICNTGDSGTKIFASSGKSMQLDLRTNVGRARRFSGSYRSYEYNAIITESKFGYIASPGFPLQKFAKSYFSWIIWRSRDSLMNLRITNLYLNDTLNCTHNHLKIYDGGDINSPFVGTFCNALSRSTIVSTSNALLLVFETDGSRSYNGFSATYSSADINLSVVLTRSPEILTRDVTLNWTTDSPLVPYKITWIATEDSSDLGEMVAIPSGGHIQGLTPGTEYSFTVLSITQGDDYYNNITFLTNFTFETLPAPPGKLNESSSNFHKIPYVLRFEPSEGRVARYNIAVAGKSYEVFNPELTVNDLTPDTQYTYTITAYNRLGNGSEDVTGSFKTDSESLNVALVAGVTISFVVVMTVGVVVMTLVIRNRRGKSEPTTRKKITDNDYNAIDMSTQSAAAPCPAEATKNKLKDSNIAELSVNVSTEQMEEREYDSIKNVPKDLSQDETYEAYETLKQTSNVGNLDGEDVQNVYTNVGFVDSHQ